MVVNNETGVIQDIEAIGALCRERGVVLHTDAAQAAGKMPLQMRRLPVDLLSLTAHKLYGPKGIGALCVREAARPLVQPILFGGGQERGLRPGTLPTHQVVGFGVACDIAAKVAPAEEPRLRALGERLWAGLAALGGTHLNGEGAPRVPGFVNVSFEGVEGESLIMALSDHLAVSTGSACNSASGDPSYVLRALGRDDQLAQSSLRFSLGRFTRSEDVDIALQSVGREVRRLRALSPASGAWPEADGVLSGEAGGPGQEVWVRFQLRLEGNTVKEARFQVYGCPHTAAIVAWLAEQLPGRTRETLIPGTPVSWAAARDVPVEKLGRLLIVEDALQNISERWPSR
jgi:hypothetical protein